MRSQVQPIPNVVPANLAQLLFSRVGVNMQSVADQLLTKQFVGTRWLASDVIAVRNTGAFSVTCLGGLYTGAGKTGDIIVAGTQTWLGLSIANSLVRAVLASVVQTQLETDQTLYVSLTTGNLITLTADFYVFGWVLD